MKLIHALITCVALLGAPLSLHAADTWENRASVLVPHPGIAEAVLPPELMNKTDNNALDLALEGPDGNRRAFELYWREPDTTVRYDLKADTTRINDRGEFLWRCKAPDHEVNALHVTLDNPRIMGKVEVRARVNDIWIILVEDAALVRSGRQTRSEIPIKPDTYQEFDLIFKGFDRDFEKKVISVERVTALSVTKGTDYARQSVTPEFQVSEYGDVTELRALLPGSGLYIDTVRLTTKTQFLGDWQIGREEIRNGQRSFVPEAAGSVRHVSANIHELTLPVRDRWNGKSLVIRLDSQGRHLGTPTDVSMELFLPRIVFSADKQGSYTALTGTGSHIRILTSPGEPDRAPYQVASFSKAEINPDLTELALTDTYRLKGGPFTNEGFTWAASVVIKAPGYYRLPFPMEASLAPNRAGTRLAKGKTQVPFFMDRTENVPTPLLLDPDYEKAQNRTTWELTLPQPSPWWVSLNLSAHGIFRRTVDIQLPKPGQMGWETWKTVIWRNTLDNETTLRIPLARLPEDQNKIRILIDHNDNEPLTLTAAEAVYTAPSICFLAYEPGPLTLHGGNPILPAPAYDLSLVRTKLMETLPTQVRAQPISAKEKGIWSGSWIKHFQANGWGLYAALGLVALVLLAIIAKVLPAAEAGKETE
ncbi:hypothetical protein [Desulfoluna spongiiphila]|uniref:hypothetical protein n=1 Tax=Desulfoluna spongiiphila TaxID=419481 RepID=UPI001253768E|nr:hypothetical protein [Desulfoluna spongiiphila]VVS90994.1 hypothetical protein DBB_5620 [Desulfoluna spongiiphila]